VGTTGYRPPEVSSGQYGLSADVYCYGMLFKRIYAKEKYPDSNFDRDLKELAEECVKKQPGKRPTFASIVARFLCCIHQPCRRRASSQRNLRIGGSPPPAFSVRSASRPSLSMALPVRSTRSSPPIKPAKVQTRTTSASPSPTFLLSQPGPFHHFGTEERKVLSRQASCASLPLPTASSMTATQPASFDTSV
jgi:serine/threonine protein kinase